MPEYVLALDQGTTSSRAILVDRDGRVAGSAQRELPLILPRPGWVEHDPEAIWETQFDTAAKALASCGATARDIAAIGVTNQRETTIAWDRTTLRPLHNAIVWQDRRTASACDKLRAEGRGELVRSRTGLEIDAYFSATKAQWLLQNVAEVKALAASGRLALGTVDTWLIARLTKGALHMTDATNASRTMLYDIRGGEWDDELLALFGVPRSALADVRASSEVYGEAAVPPLAGVPIAAAIGDQQAALAGQLCRRRSMTKCTYGTGCFMLMHTGAEPIASRNHLLTTVALRARGADEFALEGSVFVGGAIIQWLREGLGIVRTAADVGPLAASVETSGGVYLVPALTGLGAPHWDPHARGMIIGLTRGSTAAHVARAALEGIAHQVADLLDAMRADGGAAIDELRVDGGAAANDLLLQIQADLLQTPIVRPVVTETTALGAAYLAGLAVGFWKSERDLEPLWRIDRRFEPRADAARVREDRQGWARAVERAKGWADTEVEP